MGSHLHFSHFENLPLLNVKVRLVIPTVTSRPLSPSVSLQYDQRNRLTNMVDGIGTTKYAYDNVGQLNKVANSSVSTETRDYVYDAAWDLNWRTNYGQADSFTLDNLNQLTNAYVNDNYGKQLSTQQPLPYTGSMYNVQPLEDHPCQPLTPTVAR